MRAFGSFALEFGCFALIAAHPTPPSPPKAPSTLLGAPPPPAPALVAGLRSLLDNLGGSNIGGCDAACRERAEDWFEQAEKWGARSVESMVRLGLQPSFLLALNLDAGTEETVRSRLRQVDTSLTPSSGASGSTSDRDEL